MKIQVANLKNIHQQYIDNLQSLGKYIEFNKKDENAHYNQFRPIVYGAIINRAYSSWETFTKELFYEFFLLKKQEFIESGTFIKRYKIHELPGYILESLVFDSENESFNLKVSKELLVFTSKNIELKELNSLYRKIDINILNHIGASMELESFVEEKELPLANDRDDINIARALKYIILERNRTSHNSAIDDYLDVDMLEEWIVFFQHLGFLVYEKVLLFYIEGVVSTEKKGIGECKGIIQSTIGCFDIEDNTYIDQNTPIFVFRGSSADEELVDVLYAESFKVENISKDFIEGLDKAGCNFKSLIYEVPKIKKHYKYYVT